MQQVLGTVYQRLYEPAFDVSGGVVVLVLLVRLARLVGGDSGGVCMDEQLSMAGTTKAGAQASTAAVDRKTSCSVIWLAKR